MGVQLLRVLLAKVKPILMIAFTNHALDHLLEAVLDANITKNIVRLGSRASERLSQYSLETLELASNDRGSPLDKEKRNENYQLKLLRNSIEELVDKIARPEVTEEEIQEHLQMMYPEHLAALRAPAPWVEALYERQADEISQGWKTQGKPSPAIKHTMFGFWADATDLNILLAPPQPKPRPNSKPKATASGASSNRFNVLNKSTDTNPAVTAQAGASDEVPEVESSSGMVAEPEAADDVFFDDLESAWMSVPAVANAVATQEPQVLIIDPEHAVDPVPQTPLEFFSAFNMAVPNPPAGDRLLDDLLQDFDVWSMSPQERQRIYAFWTQEAREIYHTSRVAEFESLRKQFAERQKRFDSLRDQVSSRHGL